ncbi:ParA family protein [Streptomyces hydrogenans]|uniref:ParA family protein n=1 Tax=Streptomyces hydrogenans TaxID=1873719 RepID=UPI0035DBE386
MTPTVVVPRRSAAPSAPVRRRVACGRAESSQHSVGGPDGAQGRVREQQGGVGKTTTTVRLAEALAKEGRRVLVVDMNPQGNASSMLGWVGEPRGSSPPSATPSRPPPTAPPARSLSRSTGTPPTPSASRSPRPRSTWRAGCPRPASPAPDAGSTWPSTASTPTSTTPSSTASRACST